tara:strand:- start:7791 stop:8777 length:987 start_codon:yes stop_codon:yes gene_type:complete
MLHPWSLGEQPSYVEDMMNLCLDKKNDNKVAKMLLKHTLDIQEQLPTILYKLIIRGLKMCIEHPCDKTSEFLCEICAGYEFQYKNKDAGSLKETLEAIKQNSYLSHYVVQKCKEISEKDPRKGFQWFNLRILIMDVCTAFKMLKNTTKWNIFYGGDTHAKNLSKLLSIEGICNYNTVDEINKIKNYVESCSTIENIRKTKKYTILGEKHSETKLEFANKLLDFCNEKCHQYDEKVSVFVEKHPSNGNDKVQQDLTCNMQDSVSIQKFRCNYPVCEQVNIYDIDVRHVELGFLRFEFLCLDYDEEFQRLSYDFQQECLNHVKSIATIMM